MRPSIETKNAYITVQFGFFWAFSKSHENSVKKLDAQKGREL